MGADCTDWREYLRGQAPDDWNSPWAALSWPVRSIETDPLRSSWLGAATPYPTPAGVLLWNISAGGSGHGTQQVLLSFRLSRELGVLPRVEVAYLRASGTGTTGSGYCLAVDYSTREIHIHKRTAGVLSASLGSASISAIERGAPLWARFDATAGDIQARLWSANATEPGVWGLKVVDGSFSDGEPGLAANLIDDGGHSSILLEHRFFGFGTNGVSAPGPSSIPAGLATWALDPEAKLEFTMSVEGMASDESTEVLRFSTRGRSTDSTDYPPSAEMQPYLVDPGSLSLQLDGDLLYGLGAATMGEVLLRNPRRVLSNLSEIEIAGGRLVVRAGLASWTKHRWFEPVYSGIVDAEPAIEETISIPLQAPYAAIDRDMIVRKHIGIATGLVINSGTHTLAHLADYDVSTFWVHWRIRFAAAPGTIVTLSKSTSLAAEQFRLAIETTGLASVRSSVGGVPGAISMTSLASVCDGLDHSISYGVDATNMAYLAIDGEIVASAQPPGLVDTPATGIVMNGFAGQMVYDFRMLSYCPDPRELTALVATRATLDDAGLLALVPFDDGAGTIGTDYSALTNNWPLSGTEGVTYVWTATNQGDPDVAGQPMPIAVGGVNNAPAQLIDVGRQRFRFNDGAQTAAISQLVVRSQGKDLSRIFLPIDYNSVGDGVIEMVNAGAEVVTFSLDALDDSFSHTYRDFPNVLEELLTERLGLTEADYDPIAIEALGALFPSRAAFFAADTPNGAAAISEFVAGVAGHLRVDRDARIVPAILLPPITPGPLPGEAALEFPGVERAEVQFDRGTVNLGSGVNAPHTIMAWIKDHSLAINRGVSGGDLPDLPGPVIFSNLDPLGVGGAAGASFCLNKYSQGQLYFGHPGLNNLDTSHHALSAPGVVQWGTWTCVVAQYDPGSPPGTGWMRRFYAGPKGGILALAGQTTLNSGSVRASSGLVRIGSDFPGAIQHVQVWNRVLSPAELQSAMYNPTSVTSGRIFYAPLNEGAGDRVDEHVTAAEGIVLGARWCPRLVFDLRSGLSRSRLRNKRLRPAWNVEVRWGRNYRPLADNEVDASVDPAVAAVLKREWRVTPSSDEKVRRRSRGRAREIKLDSGLQYGLAARQVNRMVSYRFAPERLQAALLDAPRAAMSLRLTDEIWVFHPDLRQSQGAAFRIVGFSPQSRSARFNLDLWGNRHDLGEAQLITDTGSVITTDDELPITTD